MRKKYLPFIAIAIMILFAACSSEDLITEENIEPQVEGRTISLTASIPDEEPATRVALTRDEKNINLTWQSGDRLQFAIVQGTTKVKRVITLTQNNITNNAKTVSFAITVPSEIDDNEPFDLYGLYSNYKNVDNLPNGLPNGLSETNPTNVILTRTPGSMGTLTAVQNRGDVMIYFKSSVTPGNPPTTVTFKHLGSLFAISLKNTSSTSLTGFQELRLQGVGGGTDEKWAYNSSAGGQIFDLETEQFQNKDSGGNFISFNIPGPAATFAANATATLWGWYPPLPHKNWPALQLQLIEANGTTIVKQSVNSKLARTAPTAPGRTYHFYARWDGTDLVFTNDTFTTPSPALN